MSYTFDGPGKRIVLDSTDPVDVVDLYSRWKQWVADGHAQYAPAFRSVAGDPIGAGQTIAPYLFLNTPDGWRIRPAEASHTLRLSGNLYPEDPEDPLFAPPLTSGLIVTTVVERSASAIAVVTSGGGGDAPTAQQVASAVWGSVLASFQTDGTMGHAMGETPPSGLTSTQATMLLEVYRLLGLDPTKPLVVTQTARTSGVEIEQSITENPPGTVTVRRQ